MNKKLLVVSILAVFLLLAISFSTAVSSTSDEKRESPLFRIRTRKAIGERLDELKEAIKAKFIGERVFFLPFQWLRNGEEFSLRQRLMQKETNDGGPSCWYSCRHPIICTIGTVCGSTACNCLL